MAKKRNDDATRDGVQERRREKKSIMNTVEEKPVCDHLITGAIKDESLEILKFTPVFFAQPRKKALNN